MDTTNSSHWKRGVGPGWKFWAALGVWVAFAAIAGVYADTLAATLLPF